MSEPLGSPPIVKFDEIHRGIGPLMGGTIRAGGVSVFLSKDPEKELHCLADILRDQIMWLRENGYEHQFLEAAMEDLEKVRVRLHQYSQDRLARGVTGTNAP